MPLKWKKIFQKSRTVSLLCLRGFCVNTTNTFPKMFILSLFSCSSNEVVDSDSEDPQVYESMCNIQAQAGSSETAQAPVLGNVHTSLSLS